MWRIGFLASYSKRCWMIRYCTIFFLLIFNGVSNAVSCRLVDTSEACDTIIISIDQKLIRTVSIPASGQYDSTTTEVRVIVQIKNECNIRIQVWYNSLYYELTLPSDLRAYGRVIHLSIYTSKVKKSTPSVCSYGAQAGQLGVCGYGIVMKCEPNE